MAKKLKSFKCTGCGNCCRWPGYVRLTSEEVDAIADFLQIPVAEFIDRYTYLTEDRRNLSIIEREDGACFFLTEDDRCQIQEVKPQQCKNFPFFWSFPDWESKCNGDKEFVEE